MKTPAVLMVDPKFARNVAEALRSCALLGAEQLLVTGSRAGEWDGSRRPREFRMERYSNVQVRHVSDAELPHLLSLHRVTPVAVEITQGAEPLLTFEHPENPLYVLGPEDGTLGKDVLSQCHRFVVIPSDDCLNVAHCVTAILLHRRLQLAGRNLCGSDL